MLDNTLIIAGSIINFSGALVYVVHTLQGKTKPNRVTWLLWGLAPMLAFAAQLDKGVGLLSLLTLSAGLGPLLILAASFANRKSVWKLSNFDIGCGALSVSGLILWLITGDGLLAIILAILADGFAALPTILKSFRHPQTESWLAFFTGSVGVTLTMVTINNWTFANYGFAAYILFVNTLLAILIKFEVGPRFRASAAAR
jgi:hypothetical protein